MLVSFTLADAFGYLGSVVILLYKKILDNPVCLGLTFVYSAYSVAGIGFLVTISSMFI
jgi:hypothetical protein